VQKSNLPDEDFNPSLHTGDDPINVLENRRVIFETVGLDSDLFTAAQQVHGNNIVRITESERGRGAHSYADAIPATDALITNLPGVPIGVFTADCVPVFLFDPKQMAVGIAHAGWRSTAKAIARETVERMGAEFNSNPADIWAGVGPSIGACCYEVGRDVFDAFTEKGALLFRQTKDEKWHLDLWLANRLQLEEAGLAREKIIETRICSACNADEYFSARKLGSRTGRTLSLIAIKPTGERAGS
jgi:YfiH family protein